MVIDPRQEENPALPRPGAALAAAGASRGAQAARRARLLVMLCLAVFAATFAVGAWRWLLFHDEVGGPIALFTQTDFPAVVIASRIASQGDGAALYDLERQLQEQQRLVTEGRLALSPGDTTLRYPYPYAPFLAVLWSPLASLSPLVQMALYGIVNLAAFTWGFRLLLSALPLSRLWRWLLLLGALTSFPFVNNLEQGQSSGLVMLGFGAGIALLRKEQDLMAGVALGLLLLKVQWLPLLVLVLLWKRRWKALAGLAAVGLALLAIAVAALGTGWVSPYLGILGQAQGYSRTLLLDPLASHSFGGGVAALLRGLSDDSLKLVSLACTLAAAGLLLYGWRGPWKPGSATWDGLMGLTVLGAIFTNLHLNTHDLCLLAIPVALGVAYLQREGEREPRPGRAWYGLAMLAYLVPAYFLPQTFASPVRWTTLVMLLMLVLLAWRLLSRPAIGGTMAEPA